MRLAKIIALKQVAQRNAARAMNAGNFSPDSAGVESTSIWMRLTAATMAVVMYLSPIAFIFDNAAHAAPIVDPRAPIAFTPTITQTSTGVPAVNISAPNSHGISVNQYSTFDVTPAGLVLNNSTTGGTPLLGGTLGANPNLGGRPASLIINQVTLTGPASLLLGVLEVFGTPASIVVSTPNGIQVNGLSLVNSPNLTLTTGTPQFLSGVNGTPTTFANAGAAAYQVSGGNISVNGPPGTNGPGAGIEGTVGNIDLIAQSVTLDAPLKADQKVNLITGNQLVSPSASGASGNTYSTTPNGVPLPAGSVAVDANQYGSVTSGQIFIVSTGANAGGVHALGPLAATAGNVVVNSNGDITVGKTFASQDVNLTSAGSTTITDAGLANGNYTVSSAGDITAPGAVSAGQNVTLTAAGDLSATSVAANGSANLTAGGSMSLGSLSAHDLDIEAKNGNLTLGSTLTAPGTIKALAGQVLTVNGAVNGGSTVALTGGNNATVNGPVSAVGDVTVVAQTGNVLLGGAVQTNGALAVTAGQDVTLDGTVQAQGPVSVAAQSGSLTGTGDIASQGAVNLSAAQNLALSGNLASGNTLNATAGADASLGGTVSAPGAATLSAGRDLTVTGAVQGGSATTLTAGRNVTTSGSVTSVGDLAIAGQTGNVALGSNVQSDGALTVKASQNVALSGTAQAQGPVSVTAQSGSLTGNGNVSSSGAVALSAGQAMQLAGNVAAGTSLNASAGSDATFGGTMSAPGAINVSAAQDLTVTDAVQGGSTTTLTAGRNATTSGPVTSVGNLAITAQSGSATLDKNVQSNAALTVKGGQNVTLDGTAQAQGPASITAQSGSLTGKGDVTSAGAVALAAGQDMKLTGDVGAGSTLNATAGNDAMLAGTVTSQAALNVSAARDLSVTGAVQGGSTVALTAGRNATTNGSVSGIGNVDIAAQTGNAQIGGNVQSNDALTVNAAQNVALFGTTQAQGPVSITATNGSLTGAGAISSSAGAVNLNAGQNLQLNGNLAAGTTLSANAAGNVILGGQVSAPGAVSVQAGQDATINGSAVGGSTLNVTAGGNTTIGGVAESVGDMTLAANTGTLTTSNQVATNGALDASGAQGVNLGGTVSAGGNATIASSAGSVAVNGALSTPGQINVSAAQNASIAGGIHSGQSTTITSGQDALLGGNIEVDGPTSNATITAARDVTGTGTVQAGQNTTLTAGRNLSMTGTIETGNNLGLQAGQNLTVGPTLAAGGTETVTATNGSATLGGAALSAGDMTVTAGADVTAQGSVKSLGNLSVNAQIGNLSANGPVQAAGNATLNAGQTLALNGAVTVSKNLTLTGNNITTQGLAVGGNLAATAQNNLDTSAGQVNSTAFDPTAPITASTPAFVSVNGTATLTGASVTTANAVIGGAYNATGTNSLTTGGNAIYLAGANLNGGTVTNVGQQLVNGNLAVTGTTVLNQGVLSSQAASTFIATNLTNSGLIQGLTNTLNVANSTTNSGALVGVNALNLATTSLNNSNGLIFAGNLVSPSAASGDATVTLSGGNGSFNNTNGEILGAKSLTLNLPNQAFDPSAATNGTLNGGSAFNLAVQSINNSGTWSLPETAVTVTAAQGVTNSGAINQASGSLTLNGSVTNSGAVSVNDVTINGALANQAGATISANDAFTLNGSGTNAGTIGAANVLNITGASYDNSNGITQAGNSSSAAGQGNVNINLTGDLSNSNGVISATNDIGITANNINNSAQSSSSTTTTTTTIVNSPLLMSTVIGTETLYGVSGSGSEGSNVLASATTSATLGDLLSPTGALPTVDEFWTFFTFPVASAPVATSGSVQYVEIPTVVDSTGDAANTQNLWYVQTGSLTGAVATTTLTVPIVTETSTSTQATTGNSVIAAGHNLSINANTLNNQGGTVSAGNDANINVQSLLNGGATYTSSVTDSVDAASMTAFLQGLASKQVAIHGSGNASGTYACDMGFCNVGPATPPSTFTIDAPAAVALQTVSSSVTVQGATGQIVAGHNLNLSGGTLTNAGTLEAGNDVNVNATSFTNQGTNNGTKTVSAGCAAGYSAGCATETTTNPNSETYAYQQANSNVTAGNDVVIAANNFTNQYGNVTAGRNVVIGGVGTTASDASTTPTALTQAGTVTNTSGTIQAINDVNINAGTLTNTIAAPAQVHQNYGSATPFAGCNGSSGGGSCEAYVDVQSANPSTITANHNVNITSGSFSNTGSLIGALNNVAITATGSGTNSNQSLNAYWHGDFTHITTSFAAWGCANDPALCQQLYGSAYNSSDAQDPAGLPSAVGLHDFVAGTIQAGNTLSVNAPNLTNSGNVIGQSVSLTGVTLTNGITNPNVYTPPPAVSNQVVPLGPIQTPTVSGNVAVNGQGQPTSVTGAGGLNPNSPVGVQTVGKAVAPTITEAGAPGSATVGTLNGPGGTSVSTLGAVGGPGAGSVAQVSAPAATSVQIINGKSYTVNYLTNNPAANVMGDITPASLLANLPASLQPANVPFYYDPYAEDQLIQQAALTQTGKDSFYSTTNATDSTGQASIENQDKAALYGASIAYAQQNNIALGTQLSAAQLALINQPMLWYVQQTVPEPGCTAVGGSACPTEQALMPEVLLPTNFASVNADGEISGNSVTLNYANSILNTGTISAQDLTINTGSLSNETRSTNIGTVYQEVYLGVDKTTGTVLQQGGVLSASNYDINAQTINDAGTIQQTNADGSFDSAGTAATLADLKASLGSSFTQSTPVDDLNTTLIADQTGFNYDQLFQMVAIVALSVMTAGAGSALALSAGVTSAIGGAVANAAFAAMLASTASGVMNGNVSITNIAEAVAIAVVTAGVVNGVPVGGSTIAQYAGASPAVGTTAATAGTSVAANLPSQALALGTESVVQAGVQTAFGQGSFLSDLRGDAISNFGAAGAFDIGGADLGTAGSALAHSILGCAEGAASGTGCESGAIGGATSSLLAGYLVDQAGGAANLTNADRATITAIAMLSAGGVAGLLGQNAIAAATTAENEALNNSTQVHGGDLVSQVCGSIGSNCSDATIRELTQAQAQLSEQATANLQSEAPYVAAGLGLGFLGPDALIAAAVSGGFDYGGDAASYVFGLSQDGPSISKSFITGIIGGVAYPFLITDESIAQMGTGGKIAANGYNAAWVGTSAFGSSAITHQESPDLSAGMATGVAATGTLAKAALPLALGAFANLMIQGIAGPLQSYIQNNQSKANK
jgi:filamentous hemagglutinin